MLELLTRQTDGADDDAGEQFTKWAQCVLHSTRQLYGFTPASRQCYSLRGFPSNNGLSMLLNRTGAERLLAY